jgi:hypothetical protein
LFQERSPAGTRALASATMLLLAVIFGQGGGPFFIGAMSDLLNDQGSASPLAMGLVLASSSLVLSGYFQFSAGRIVPQGSDDTENPRQL